MTDLLLEEEHIKGFAVIVENDEIRVKTTR